MPHQQVQCGNLPFVIRRDGTWLHQGDPITRPALLRLFASVLCRDAAGAYWLETPAERGRIVVEDAPFLVVELHRAGAGHTQTLDFRTNVDDWIKAGPDHPLRLGHDAVPRLHVRPGQGAMAVEARLSRAVYYQLAEYAVVHPAIGHDLLGVWSRNCFFIMGDAK